MMQTAEFTCKDGTVLRGKVPAFPDNPPLVIAQAGIKTWGLTTDMYFAASTPVIGFGTTMLAYHEVEPYQLP